MGNEQTLKSRVSSAELNCLFKYARRSLSKCFLEIGTLNLGTGQRLAEELSEHLIVTIDFSNYAYRNVKNSANLMRWLGYSRNYAKLLTKFKCNLAMKFGVIFLDGGHSYEVVDADKEAWELHLADDGVFAIHDSKLVEPYVEALNGHKWNGYREGPARMVEEMQTVGWALIEETDSISIMKRIGK